ncbi:MAG TPA: metal ABC transporter permease [Spirochaetales bacterium]|nr:metal ABC transporter permease [Spirochaetales bacterium]
MNGFIEALLDPSLPFVRNALAMGLLSSVLFGVVGSVVTVRRIAGLAGAISHAVLGGVGLALFLKASGVAPWLTPRIGALAFALLAAALVGLVSLKAKAREDTVINAIWAIGMSIGVLFLARTPGYADPMAYLFGNILLVGPGDLAMVAVLDLVVAGLAWRFYAQVEAASFDEEFARTRGVNTDAVFLGILGAVAVSVVLLSTFVGIVLVIAMLTLPAGTASGGARNLKRMMLASTLLAAAFSTGGLALAWELDLPAGAVVVVLSGGVFLASQAARAVRARGGRG